MCRSFGNSEKDIGEKMVRYKRLKLVFYSIFFIFIFQNLSATEHLNLNCKKIKKDNLIIESITEKIPYSVSVQESDESYTVDNKMVLFLLNYYIKNLT